METHRMKWKKEDVSKLLEQYNLGLNSAELAIIFNCSRRSITNKLHKLGFNIDTSKSFKHLYEKRECLICKTEFDTTENENKRFCSQSCSVSFSNKKRKKSREDSYCINCNTLLKYDNEHQQLKYCSLNCQCKYERNSITQRIENGDTTMETRIYKRYLIEKYGRKCMKCGWCEINIYSNTVPIELEHKDGDSKNNSLDNLELLCPNHHSLTPTYKTLNKGKGRYSRSKRYKEGKSY